MTICEHSDFLSGISPFSTDTEKASESSQSQKLVWLPSMLPVTSTAIHPVQCQAQVGDHTNKYCWLSFFFFPFLYNFSLVLKSFFLFLSIYVYGLDSVPKMKPRIQSASLSQSVAVDETVLPAASQNITAYAVNTEPSQRYRHTCIMC